MNVLTFFRNAKDTASGEGSTILVVDDSLDCQKVLNRLFTQWGYGVQLADSGERALSWLKQSPRKPDLAILDIAMEGMSGLELCRQIRQLPEVQELPVLFLTGDGDLERYEAAVAAGGDDFLTKPFDPIGLGIRVRSLLRLRDLQRQRQQANDALRRAHEELERRVEARTAALNEANTALLAQIASREAAQRELEATHRQLLEASRLAGRAEVATGVLHNVGNILNSINLSASLLSGNARHSKLAGLFKLSSLLREHAADLPTFFAQDPRAKQIPSYVEQIANVLENEQRQMQQEIAQIHSLVTHIGSIVLMQQNYARVAGFSESLTITDVVEEALQVQAASYGRHDIQIRRVYEETPPVCIERHKVLQILVNLIQNAKQALLEAGQDDKCLTVGVKAEGERLRVTVGDNGVGIAPENLARIFAHGFTTKKDGHGFGLHNSALAAREMGGSLSVHSDGLGRGTVFTLELPLPSDSQKLVSAA